VAQPHPALAQRLLVRGDAVDRLPAGQGGMGEQGVVDVDLEQVDDLEAVRGHGVHALVDDAAVGVLEGEDAQVDLAPLDGAEHLGRRQQLDDLDIAQPVVAGVLERRLLRERAADTHDPDPAHVSHSRSPPHVR
jgi:hypothetical protein